MIGSNHNFNIFRFFYHIISHSLHHFDILFQQTFTTWTFLQFQLSSSIPASSSVLQSQLIDHIISYQIISDYWIHRLSADPLHQKSSSKYSRPKYATELQIPLNMFKTKVCKGLKRRRRRRRRQEATIHEEWSLSAFQQIFWSQKTRLGTFLCHGKHHKDLRKTPRPRNKTKDQKKSKKQK